MGAPDATARTGRHRAGIVGDQRSRGRWRPDMVRLAWDRLARVCGQYLAKGQQVAIEGRRSSTPKRVTAAFDRV